MAVVPRLIASAATAIVPLLALTACGDNTETGSRTTLEVVQGTNYVLKDPVTTTSTTTLPNSEPTPGVNPNEQQYTVQRGDSVYRIADLHGIDDPQILANWNKWAEGVFHPLQVGDVVNIPPGFLTPGASTGTDTGTDTATGDDTGDDTATPANGTLPDGSDCPTTYTIQQGDTVRSRVADKFGITFQEMDAANSGTPGYSSFIPGTEIVIPCPA